MSAVYSSALVVLGAVAGVGFDADQNRMVFTGPRWLGGGVLERVRGDDAIVVIGGRDERRGIFSALDIVQRRVA